MKVKSKWTRSTLANNLRYYRSEHGLSQREIAKKTGVSYRLVQDLEAGEANPTLETLHKIAIAFKITVEDLISLSYLRLIEEDSDFLERFKTSFKISNIAVALRSLNGVSIWGNKLAEKIHGGSRFDKGPVDLMECFSPDSRALLKIQMAAEKHGAAYSYTISHNNPITKETVFLRSYPTLILPNKGKTPVYTSVYFTEISEDCAENYYEYCKTLLGAVYNI